MSSTRLCNCIVWPHTFQIWLTLRGVLKTERPFFPFDFTPRDFLHFQFRIREDLLLKFFKVINSGSVLYLFFVRLRKDFFLTLWLCEVSHTFDFWVRTDRGEACKEKQSDADQLMGLSRVINLTHTFFPLSFYPFYIQYLKYFLVDCFPIYILIRISPKNTMYSYRINELFFTLKEVSSAPMWL
jgi:hypothetical protein